MITAFASLIIALGITITNIIQTLALTGYKKLICCKKEQEIEMSQHVCEEEEKEDDHDKPPVIPRPTLSIQKGYDSSSLF